MPLAALSVDVARWYVEIERVQNAADAAAMAGVTFLPDDFDNAEEAAKAVAARNGYPDSGASSVSVTTGAKPTQLKVTVSSTINNGFASAFDMDLATMSRSAVADYNGPAPLGSPCNAFGNEPAAGAAEPLGSGSQIVVPTGGATCSATPQLWGAIAGPETPKGNGDGHMTRKCDTGNSGCSAGKNDEFRPLGYFYIVRVAPAAVNTDVTIQIYDPAFVETGDVCEKAPTEVTSPSGYGFKDAMNDYVTDGLTRYKREANGFCAGDVLTSDTAEAPVTSFALRTPTDTYRPANGLPMLGTDGHQCERQYKGYKRTETTSQTLRKYRNTSSSNTSYNDELAKVHHQWVTMCTFRPQSAGDHYLQIRTNVKIPASAVADGRGGYRSNSDVYTQAGDDTSVKGNGNNRFALRVTGPQRSSVSISGWDTMSIYANYTGALSTFNLVRVIPAAASKNLLIDFYDVGDATNPGTITVLPPLDSNMASLIPGAPAPGSRTARCPDAS